MITKPNERDLDKILNTVLCCATKVFGPQLVSTGVIGSAVRMRTQRPLNDLDIYMILDDESASHSASWAGLKENAKKKIMELLGGMSFGSYEKEHLDLHIYMLPEFFKRLLAHDPFITVLIREGIPAYDRNVIKPLKNLLLKGDFLPSAEAAKNYLYAGNELIKNARRKLDNLVSEDLYFAAVTVAQALFMAAGKFPYAPKEIPSRLKEMFEQNELRRPPFDYFVVEELIVLRDDLQSGGASSISLSELERLLSRLEEFIIQSTKAANANLKEKVCY